jgi:hypothetical protein
MDDLGRRWGVEPATARKLCRKWKIRTIHLSGRVVRVRPGDVEEAEKRAEKEPRRTAFENWCQGRHP